MTIGGMSDLTIPDYDPVVPVESCAIAYQIDTVPHIPYGVCHHTYYVGGPKCVHDAYDAGFEAGAIMSVVGQNNTAMPDYVYAWVKGREEGFREGSDLCEDDPTTGYLRGKRDMLTTCISAVDALPVWEHDTYPIMETVRETLLALLEEEK